MGFMPRQLGSKRQETHWTGGETAEEHARRCHAFVRSMTRRAIERYAAEEGYDTIIPDVMGKARKEIGM